MEEVEDVIENPPEEGQYEALKAALIKILTDSSSMRFRKLLEGEEIGDRGQPGFCQTSQNRDTSKNSRICWYHSKFGEKATKCREPCAWKSGNESSHH